MRSETGGFGFMVTLRADNKKAAPVGEPLFA